MKEIQAISKLSHQNIVGYYGCWIEAEKPDEKLLTRMNEVLKPRKNQKMNTVDIDQEIIETEEDDPDYKLTHDLNHEENERRFNEEPLIPPPDYYEEEDGS